jgi:hypothetical protein
MSRVDLRVNFDQSTARDKFQDAVGRLAEAMGIDALVKAKGTPTIHAEKPIPMLEGIIDKYNAEFAKLMQKTVTGLLSGLGIAAQKAETFVMVGGNMIWNPEAGNWLTVEEWARMDAAMRAFLEGQAAGMGYRMASEAVTSGVFSAMLERAGKNAATVPYHEAKKELSDDFLTFMGVNDMDPEQYHASKFSLIRTADYCTDMADDARSHIKSIMRIATTERWPTWKIKQKMFDDLGDLNKDFSRIASTEVGNAHADAYMENTAADAEPGEAVYYKGVSSTDACPVCQRDVNGVIARYVSDPMAAANITDPYTDVFIWPGKNSIGHGAKEKYTVITRHPWCGCRWVRMFPKKKKGEESK